MGAVVQRGFLFDLFAKGSEMVLWFLTDAGEAVRLVEEFRPEIFLDGPGRELEACLRAMTRAGDVEPGGWVGRRDFWTGEARRVFAVRVRRVETWRVRLARHAQRFPRIAWFNADLLPEQLYCYSRDVFPLARCTFAGEAGRLTAMTVEDDRWRVDYETPPLRVVELHGAGTLWGRRPRLDSLTLTSGGTQVTWDEADSPLPSFQRALDEIDPDVILTDDGDAFLFPLLLTVARRSGFALRLDREPPPRGRREISLDGRSYFSYGRILYQPPNYPLFGRWHLDRQGAFLMGDGGLLDGLFETVRLSRLPIQHLARRSIGTSITSVQLDLAHREGFLIPWKKTRPEAWKTAGQLLRTDRGGLVYAPEIGFHEGVVELDFVSMYPSIMARFNVSPETVGCACCRNARVPEIGYSLCERRQGLVSRALAPIIEKRARYKALRRAAAEAGDEAAHRRFDDRQSALKWMLVCCFGYLGYRNARFGRIEAHEAVSAFARELLLVARETCEARGWRVLHANVDSVWIAKPGFAREEIAPLCEAIGTVTGLDIALEGIYRWIAFLPSREFADRPVPTRFFGVFDGGSLKFRGIECRRRDLPVWIREAQARVLAILAAAPDRAGYEALIPQVREEIDALEGALRRREVALDQLVIRQRLSREPAEYHGPGAQALAARQAVRAGLRLHAGQLMSYLLTDMENADRERRVCLAALADATTTYDPAAYIRLLRRAMNTLLWPVGVALDETLRAPSTRRRGRPRRTRPRRAGKQLDWLPGERPPMRVG